MTGLVQTAETSLLVRGDHQFTLSAVTSLVRDDQSCMISLVLIIVYLFVVLQKKLHFLGFLDSWTMLYRVVLKVLPFFTKKTASSWIKWFWTWGMSQYEYLRTRSSSLPIAKLSHW